MKKFSKLLGKQGEEREALNEDSDKKDKKEKKEKKEKKKDDLRTSGNVYQSPSERQLSPQQPQQNSPPPPVTAQKESTVVTPYQEMQSQLEAMFTDLDPLVIQLTLKDCQGNIERAIDSLLNLQAIASSNTPRGGQSQPQQQQAQSPARLAPRLTIHDGLPSPTTSSPNNNGQRSELNRSQGVDPIFSNGNPTGSRSPLSQSGSHNVKYTENTYVPISSLNLNSTDNINSTSTTTTTNHNNNNNGTHLHPISAIYNQDSPVSAMSRPTPSDVQFTQAGSIDDQLIQAARDQNLKKIQNFMDNYLKSLQPFKDLSSTFNTCLILLIERSNLMGMRMFLENSANPNGIDHNPSPLAVALQAGEFDCAKALLVDYKCDPNKSNMSLSPLHLATSFSAIEIVRLLIDHGAYLNRIDPDTGRTALHMAIANSDYDIASKLIESGTDLHLKDIQGESALHLAVRICKSTTDMMLLCLLLEKAQENSRALNAQNNKTGETVLHVAVHRVARANNYPLDLVLKYNPDASIKDHSGLTPMELAIKEGKSEVAKMLAEYMKRQEYLKNQNGDIVMTPSVAINPISTSASSPINKVVKVEKQEDSDEEELRDSRRRFVQTPNVKTLIPSTSTLNLKEQDPDWMLVKTLKEKIDNALDHTLEEEYNSIESLTTEAILKGDFTSALAPVNAGKNRYRNILPLENTRVKLKKLDGVEGSDYINANFISSDIEGKERAYIVTQGPLEGTVDDFWRMMYEQNSSVVVMLSTFIENGRAKVYPYFPEQCGQTMETPLFIIKTDQEHTKSQLIHRRISLTIRKTQEQRIVNHLQYIAWPDQGLPENTAGFRSIIDKADHFNTVAVANNNSHSSSNGSLNGMIVQRTSSVSSLSATSQFEAPIVVHCSAGIGRSGVFCVVHNMLTKLKLLLSASFQSCFDVKETLIRMRNDRVALVQTKEQYVFCHLALRDSLREYLNLLGYKNERWFHKRMDATTANQLLAASVVGTFLFRASSVSGFIILSYNTPNTKNTGNSANLVQHTRIGITDRGFKLDEQLFPSLRALVEAKKDILKQPHLQA